MALSISARQYDDKSSNWQKFQENISASTDLPPPSASAIVATVYSDQEGASDRVSFYRPVFYRATMSKPTRWFKNRFGPSFFLYFLMPIHAKSAMKPSPFTKVFTCPINQNANGSEVREGIVAAVLDESFKDKKSPHLFRTRWVVTHIDYYYSLKDFVERNREHAKNAHSAIQKSVNEIPDLIQVILGYLSPHSTLRTWLAEHKRVS